MRNFWQGMLWGSLVGTVLGAVVSPMVKPQRKPLVERGADAFMSTTSDLMKEARRARRRLMHKFD